ncbi:MAG: thioesterase family protein [Methanosarcinaceae archaeon]|nr:thioesterase family protein [Methanosarcinaceae archaeon]MDD4330735.1 thioesterase family protein [Methanosarcinaceae archaeon]MDD4749010.1 thioesterase family protein [Methanosarcinaceae archaeon]
MFTTTIAPRFGDIDGLGHVNNTIVPVWFEMGRNSIFRLFTPDLDLRPEKWHLILVRTEFDFLSQMYFDGDVEIRTYITKLGNTSFTVGHEAWQRGGLKAKGLAVLVYYDFKLQKPLPIPAKFRKVLEEHLISRTNEDSSEK